MPRITKRYVDSVIPPDKGYILKWDDGLKGFGLKVTAKGTRTLCLLLIPSALQYMQLPEFE